MVLDGAMPATSLAERCGPGADQEPSLFKCRATVAREMLPTIGAQTPTNHILTAESGMAPDGFFYVDPATGQVTPVTEPNGNFLGGARTVSVSGADPTGSYTSAGGSFGGAPVWRLEMVGSNRQLPAEEAEQWRAFCAELEELLKE